MRCLFLAPLKHPDDPKPSGDRLIARQFVALLGRLGFSVEIATDLRTRCSTPADLHDVMLAARRERSRILDRERRAPERPALVFTYHNYYRAPDLIGPALAGELDAPYVIAESSRAPRRAQGEWSEGHRLAEAASDAADMIIAPTAHDMEMLAALQPAGQALLHLKPFIEAPQGRLPGAPLRSASGPARLLTVAMMRRGNKVCSYLALAGALGRVADRRWTLDIVGDGEGRGEVAAAFATFGGDRVRFHGAIDDAARLSELYAAADLFVWPAIEEPIGMVFLEAQAQGAPCLAYGYRGVPDVVENGVAGVVVAPGDEDAFVAALGRLLDDAAERSRLGGLAYDRFQAHHTLASAARSLSAAFREAGLPTPHPAR